jgi:fructose-1,6-bisphosphatase I
MRGKTLNEFLIGQSDRPNAPRDHLVDLIERFAKVAIKLRLAIQEGALGAAFAATLSSSNADGDDQKALDVHADTLFLKAATEAGVAFYASEEQADPMVLDGISPLSVAIDPLDGSSNIDTNITIGTIFSILPSLADAESTFLQRGTAQIAAGFFVYGPQLALVLTLGAGTSIFVFSEREGVFLKAYSSVTISPEAKEFALNMSNYRHWDPALRAYADDCLAGVTGPRGKNFNMRWIASLVAETYRILVRGGVFMYPRDNRKGYDQGRLRLVYEANPVAFLIEQAGGDAMDGHTRILDLKPQSLHERTPFMFGAKNEIATLRRYHADPTLITPPSIVPQKA